MFISSLATCEGNPRVLGAIPVTSVSNAEFDVFIAGNLNKLLNKLIGNSKHYNAHVIM